MTHTIVDIHGMINGTPQRTSRGASSDKHQVVRDPHIIPFGVLG